MKKLISYVGLALAMVVLGCSNSVNNEKENNDSDKALGIYNVRQLVAKDNKTSRTIMWHSKAKQNDYELELQMENGNSTNVFKAQDYSFKDGKGEYIQYGVYLDALTAGEKYKYRINQGQAKGSCSQS